ncbi:unnamed protein product [Arctia plantaginis]|uniref:Uncharacterized protein n=1 Tax=Arctia plantaginis TaxID=874455 RepID=A0A8S1ALT5_ARCPL|nr:unnamed protein product [Arctia plantaginis]
MLKSKFLLIIITALLVCMITVNESKKRRKIQGPRLSHKESTSCSEFSKYGRFNPYSVLNETWFVFFYWAAPRPIDTYRFFIPTANHTKILHKVFDGKVTVPVNWTARLVIMQNRFNTTWLLVERGDRGQYWSYMLRRAKKKLIKAQNIRLRQHDNGRLLGLMECQTEFLYVMSRIREVPLHNRLQDEAARFGFRARRGKSYLYQGHEWMPIPEADENDYFETLLPDLANETNNPEEITLHVSDQSTEDRKTCSLKEKLSKYKSVDFNSPDSCIQTESSKVSKKADSNKIRIDKSDCNDEWAESADFDSKREEKLTGKGKSGKANYDTTKTEGADQKEKVDSDNLRAENPASDNLRLENVESDVRSESQFTNERKEPDPTNEFVEQSSKIQTPSSSKILGEREKLNDIREDQYTNGLKESESAFANIKDLEKSTDVPMDTETKVTTAQKNLHSTDLAEDITDDLPNDWGDFHKNSYTTYLRPVENTNFIEQEPPKINHKIKDPIASSGVLPEKCYKMEMVSETEDFTPAYVPPIFNEMYETETTINSKTTMQEKHQN